MKKIRYDIILVCFISVFIYATEPATTLQKNIENEDFYSNSDYENIVKKYDKLIEKYPEKKFRVGIRCNFNLSNFKISRFGINYANGDLAKAINILNTHNQFHPHSM